MWGGVHLRTGDLHDQKRLSDPQKLGLPGSMVAQVWMLELNLGLPVSMVAPVWMLELNLGPLQYD